MRNHTAEEIHEHIEAFTPIYDNKGNEINPLPKEVKLTVYCDDGRSLDNRGYAENVTRKELGLEVFIAQKWIIHADLLKLLEP